MPAERYFVPFSLKENETIQLDGIEFHHLAHVMRTREGETVELINGQGALAEGLVEKIFKDKSNIKVKNVTLIQPNSKTIILAQAMPKLNRLEYILEKGTELGVDEFWLFPGETSVKKEFSTLKLERLNKVLVAAMKQCGRLFLPKIQIKESLTRWESFSAASFFGDLDAEAPPLWRVYKTESQPFPCLFVIGPESGFSDNEIKFLKEKGIQGVKLHDNVLRTDTAAILAIGLIRHLLL